jgi:hypothetical protein
MRKSIFSLFVLSIFVVFSISGCSTKTAYIQNYSAGGEDIDPSANFSIGEVKDSSGYKFKEDDKYAFNIAETMKDALKNELEKRDAFGEPGKYTINVEVTEYAPGSAFARWLFPGAGATVLKIQSAILNQESQKLAEVPVERSIAAGGAYTAGAWKYVFEEVATALVDVLKDTTKRKK